MSRLVDAQIDSFYRQNSPPDPVDAAGHPLLDQVQGQLVDPGAKVTVYELRSGTWAGCARIVIRSSKTHLEHMCPTLKEMDIKITKWNEIQRWLA